MVGHATDLALDGHGRMLLPPELREFAGLRPARDADRAGQPLRAVGRGALDGAARSWLKSEAATTDLPAQLDSLSL